MSIFDFISNAGTAIKYAKYVALFPIVMQLSKEIAADLPNGITADEKTRIIAGVDELVSQLSRRGILPAELATETEKIAGELIGVVVAVYNAAGLGGGKKETTNADSGNQHE